VDGLSKRGSGLSFTRLLLYIVMHTENRNDNDKHLNIISESPSQDNLDALFYPLLAYPPLGSLLYRLLNSEEVSDLLPHSSLEFR
jgi:hypothetical protein